MKLLAWPLLEGREADDGRTVVDERTGNMPSGSTHVSDLFVVGPTFKKGKDLDLRKDYTWIIDT